MAAKAMEQLGMSMNDITAEQKESAMALESLGIKLSDTNGPRKMSAILTELREKTKNLGREEKLAAMKAIFGQEAATGWLAVLNSGDKTFDELVTKLEKSGGAADEMAKKMQNNAKGAVTRLNSAIESTQISIGQAFLPVVASAAETGAKFFGMLAGNETMAKFAIGIGVVGVALTGFVAAVSMGSAVVNAFKTAMIAYSVISKAFQASTIFATAAQWAINTAMYACPIGWVIAGIAALVAAGYYLYTNWDTVKQFFITLWDNPKAALTSFIDGIKDKFTGAFDWISSKWKAISDFLAKPIFGKVNITAQGNGSDVAHNASGGIYGKGAFLTTFAETSGESAIPHTPTARNIGLLAETNRIMGSPLGGGSITATFAPNITVQGNGDADKLHEVLDNEMDKFRRMLSDLQSQQRRVSYA